jgi:glycogen synthase
MSERAPTVLLRPISEPQPSLADERRAGPPRVLMTTDTVGGVWSYSIQLASELARLGLVVGLATVGRRPNAAQAAEALAIPALQLFMSDFRCEWMEDCWQDVARTGTWLLELEERFRPDLIHLNAYCNAVEPFRAPVLVVAHSCVLSWWREVRGCDAPHRLERYRRSVSRGLRAADRVVAPTNTMLRWLRECYGPLPSSSVILNGSCPQRFHPERKKNFVFACGRLWDEAKNLSALEWAAPRIAWPVEVAGALEHPDGGIRAANNVRCRGVMSGQDVAARMAQAAICAHPARYEPFGLVPLEAALSGCSLVLGDTDTLREIWGDAALYVDPDEPASLVDVLDRLIGSKALQRRLAHRARARALRLTARRMGEAYLRVYGEMLRPKHAGLGARA